MKITRKLPRQALNKAYLKQKIGRADIERFKLNLGLLLDRIDEDESEEHLKNLVADFLKDVWYKPSYEINTKGRNDLVIHAGKSTADPVGVILEIKRPSNKAEMVSDVKPNVKAMHELVLYYLRERIDLGNSNIKYLIIGNIYEWYLLDELWFEKYIHRSKRLLRDYDSWKLSGKDTRFFYDSIVKPFLDGIEDPLTYTYFDIRRYEKALRNQDKKDDNKFIDLYKILSPAHLLKQPFANDSNSLDPRFYSELLHIIGLEEVKDGSKKLIQRKKDGYAASLLEDTIIKLEDKDALRNITGLSTYGSTRTEQLQNIALELCITWINRILFLKLLEAQVYRYQKEKRESLFLNSQTIHDFDELSNLFFLVLAERPENRRAHLQEKYRNVPYLNSSLFERTTLERQALDIGSLDNRLELPLYAGTVLKDDKGRRSTGKMPTLKYLFLFLDAYDFTSEGSAEIQEENKNLINASVLGLIFEKINGYKDGSFYTPGFITMYMCRETIRHAVVQKFNEVKGWNCRSLDDLYEKIDVKDRAEANNMINSLKICDPAVGSGHFLVSALNELIAIKNDLNILQDTNGKRLKEYTVEVVNDELVITDEDGLPFDYHPAHKESQRVQEAIFHEKETLIENCLFGVDINPNSVKICRLRLWIELLKHAYYTKESGYHQLETLPNIDINIKTGNSLVSRFRLDEDLSAALKSIKWDITAYRGFVQDYKNAGSKDEKRGLETLIDGIKGDFRSEITRNDPKLKRLNKLSGDLFNLLNQQQLFTQSKAEQKTRKLQSEKLQKEITKLSSELDAIRNNKVYEHAFEWRFEFPEVLDDDGNFVGFDVVIGNPPYIRQEEFSDLKEYLKQQYQVFTGTADLLVYFIERGLSVLRNNGQFTFIVANKFMRAGFGKAVRSWLQQFQLHSLMDFGDLPVFEEATTYPLIIGIKKTHPVKELNAANITELVKENFADYVNENVFTMKQSSLNEEGWNLADQSIHELLQKLRMAGKPLSEYVEGKIYRGVLTGLNEAFVINAEQREQLIAEDPKSEEVIKPFLAGRDIKRYKKPTSDKYLIFTRRGIDIFNYPAILKYLEQFKSQLEPQPKDWDGGEWQGRKAGTYKWYEIQDAVDYYEEFEKEKIIYPNICKQPEFTFDEDSLYTNQKCFIITKADKFLLGILNSTLTFFLFRSVLPKLRGDFYEPSYVYFKDFPIVSQVENHQKERLISLVNQILAIKRANLQASTDMLEREIDLIVYHLYNLTYEEVKLIDESISEEEFYESEMQEGSEFNYSNS